MRIHISSDVGGVLVEAAFPVLHVQARIGLSLWELSGILSARVTSHARSL